MGGHLPGGKVTPEIAKIRNKPAGEDIISPSRFPGISDADDLKQLVNMLRTRSEGRPVGIKIAAGRIEKDLAFCVHAGPDIDLVITGGLRVSSDFAKAIALGADAVAVASAAMVAAACQQYRICGTGMCPAGMATQDETLRQRLHIDAAAKRVENYLKCSAAELKTFARITGNSDIHGLSADDLCTVSSEISEHTCIAHAGRAMM